MRIKPTIENFATAKQLVDALNPLSSWREQQYATSEDMFFRGQFQAHWDLVPSALRPESFLFKGSDWTNPPLESVQQIKAEAKILWLFLSLCDDAGLALPEDGQNLRRSLLEFTEQGGKTSNWPPPELLSFMAFAQHSGIPTRLLDFTTDSYVASYFAAKKALDSDDFESAGTLSIWCIPSRLISDQFYWGEGSPLVKERRVQIVTAPTYMNQNLRAQKGLFLYDQKPEQNTNQMNLLDAFPPDSNPPIKLTLPHSEADELLFLLRRLGYHTASLFPSPEQIVQGIREARILDHRRNRMTSNT